MRNNVKKFVETIPLSVAMTQRARKRTDSDQRNQKHFTSLTFMIIGVQFPIKKTHR